MLSSLTEYLLQSILTSPQQLAEIVCDQFFLDFTGRDYNIIVNIDDNSRPNCYHRYLEMRRTININFDLFL